MTRAEGFSLVEVLIAASILAVALLALASMFPTGYLNVDQGGEQTTAVTLAQERIEWLRNQSYISLAAGTSTETAIPGYGGYTRTTTIQDDIPTAGVKQVTVTVATPSGRSVQVPSLIAR
ncbi:MAG: prepilin-type N-terminal cleavage/methylation domain-containing protein [Candidatus Methylomirabilales bacterium]